MAAKSKQQSGQEEQEPNLGQQEAMVSSSVAVAVAAGAGKFRGKRPSL
jgi:hypothetical protein